METLVTYKKVIEVYKFQWGHDITVVETSYTIPYPGIVEHSFNGATTLQSWKLDDIDKTIFDTRNVSMGPRHYSRGNLKKMG